MHFLCSPPLLLLHFVFVHLSDLQIVNIGLRVLYRPDPMALPRLYRNLGQDFDDRVLPSITNEVRTYVSTYVRT